MRHVRDVIRLKAAGMPSREIARRVGTAPSTIRLTIRRFEAAGLTWPLPDDVTDAVLEARLFASAGAGPGTRRGHRRQAEPDWAAVHRELKRKHVTLSILWEEYIVGEPDGYRYSRFCNTRANFGRRLRGTAPRPRKQHAACAPPRHRRRIRAARSHRSRRHRPCASCNDARKLCLTSCASRPH
jgi:hypothetical protein